MKHDDNYSDGQKTSDPYDACIQAAWQVFVERLSVILHNEQALAELEGGEQRQQKRYRQSPEYSRTIGMLHALLSDYQEIACLVGKRDEWRMLKGLVSEAADASFGLVLYGLHQCMLDVLALLTDQSIQMDTTEEEKA